MVYYQARYNSAGQLAIVKTGEISYKNWILQGYHWLTGNQFEFFPVHAVNGPDGLHYLFATEEEARNAKISDFNPEIRYTEEGVNALFTITDALGMGATGMKIPRGNISQVNRASSIAKIQARTSTFTNIINNHHITPSALRDNIVVKAAIRAGFQIDKLLEATNKGNLIPLEAYRKANGLGTHNGNHPIFSERIRELLNKFSKSKNGKFSDREADGAIQKIQDTVLDAINKNPKTKLDDLKINVDF